jgi:hypothetical protein
MENMTSFLEEQVKARFEEGEAFEQAVEAWINGNKSSVIQELKTAKGEKFTRILSEIVEHLVKEKDALGIKMIITKLAGK